MNYQLTEDEISNALNTARRRRQMNGGESNRPTDCQDDKERMDNDIAAAMSEIAVSRMLNLCWTGCGWTKAVPYDVGNAIEVRAILRLDRGLIARPKDKDDPPAVLVHVDIETGLCRALGWEVIGEVKRRGRDLPAIGNPAWVLKPRELRAMAELADEIWGDR